MKGKNVCPFKKRIFPEREVGEKKKRKPRRSDGKSNLMK